MRRSNLQRNIQARADANLASVASRWQPFIEDFIRRYNIQDPRILEILRGEGMRRTMAEPTVRFGNTDPNEPKLLDYLSRFGWQPGQQPQAPAAQPISNIPGLNQINNQPAPVNPQAQQNVPGVGTPQSPSKDIIKQAVNEHPRLPGESDDAYRKRLEDLIGRGTRGPVTPQENERQAINPNKQEVQDPRAIRQALINRIVNQIPKKYDVGETNEEYADRIRPSITDAFKKAFGMQYNNFMMDWGGMGEGYRGPITPEEIAIAEQQPDVQRRLAWQHQQRIDRLQREANEALNRQAERQKQHEKVGSTTKPSEHEGFGPHHNRPTVSEGKKEPDITPVAANNVNNNNNPANTAPTANTNRPDINTAFKNARDEVFKNNPIKKGQSQLDWQKKVRPLLDAAEKKVADEYKYSTPTSNANTPNERPVNPNPDQEPTGGTATQRAHAEIEDNAKRMEALLGQIQRTGRRATPNELTQIHDLYDKSNRASILTRDPNFIAANKQRFDRIKEEYNTQSNLLNKPPLWDFGINNPREGEAVNERRAIERENELNPASDEPAVQADDEGFKIRQIPIMTRDQMDLAKSLSPIISQSLQAASQPINYYPQQQQQANTALGNILQKIQAGDFGGAQRELTLGGGAAQLTQAANIPGLQALQPPQNLNPQQQAQFNQLFGNAQPGTAAAPGAQPQAQAPAAQPYTAGEIAGAVKDLNRMLDRAYNRGGMENGGESRSFTPDELERFQNIYARVLATNPNGLEEIHGLEEIQRFFTEMNPNIPIVPQRPPQQQPAQPQQQPQYQPGPQGFTLPGTQQAFPAAGPGGHVGERPAGDILGRLDQALNQGRAGVAGAKNIKAGAQQFGGAAKGFFPAVAEQLKAGKYGNALDVAMRQGQEGFAGLNKIFGGTREAVGAGQNIYNLGTGQPMNAVPGQPGAPGGAPVPPGGGGGQPGGQPGQPYQQYGHPLPYTAANEMNRFYSQTIPTLAERFTSLGGGQRSAAFQGSLGQAGGQFGLGLQALAEQNVPNQLAAQQQMYNQASAERAYAQNQQQRSIEHQQFEREYQRTHGGALIPYALQQRTTQGIVPAQANVFPAIAQTVGNLAGGFARGFGGG